MRRKYYDSSNESHFDVDYPISDPLLVGFDPNKPIDLDLTVYMSETQAWIESRQGWNSLATIRTIPLFFGYGPAERVFVRVNPQLTLARRYVTVAKADLLGSINRDYAQLTDDAPFLFQQGPPAAPTSLMMAAQ